MISRRSTEHIEQYCDIVRFRVEMNWFLVICRGMLRSGVVIQAEHIAKYITTIQLTSTYDSPLLAENCLVKSEFLIILGYEVYQLLVGSVPRMPGIYLFFAGVCTHRGIGYGDGSDIDKR
jgi:hypothetical protein